MSFNGKYKGAESNPLDMPLDAWLARYASGREAKPGSPGEKGLQFHSTAKPVTPEPSADSASNDADGSDEEFDE